MMHLTPSVREIAEGRRKTLMKNVIRKGQVGKIKKVRRAKRRDIPMVENLVTHRTKSFFGQVNVSELFCKCYMSTVMLDEDNKVVGCVCVNNFPNMPSIPPWYWRNWAAHLYRLNYLSPRNSLWIHFAVFDQLFASIFLYKMLEYLYERCFYVKYILLIIPPYIKSLEWMESCGVVIYPHAYYGNPGKLQRVFLTTRSDFVLYYKIRRAVVQDNDDVVNLIHEHSKMLKKLYGEYYIAELIQDQSKYEGRLVIVAEYAGVAVAVMILNQEVNYDLLNHAFKLETFYGLRKPDARDEIRPPEVEANEETLSMVYAPESVVQKEVESESSLLNADTGSQLSSVTDDDYELPTDVAADLEMIISQDMGDQDDSSGDDSLSFLGTLEDQAVCVMLSCTNETMDKWEKKKSRSMINVKPMQIYHPRIPDYHGEPNAFAIEVLAAQPDHECALRYLLQAAFESFADRDYGILCVPSTEPTFPLLKLMVRVTPRPSSNFENELYVTHRESIRSELLVREASQADIPVIEALIGKLKNPSIYQQLMLSVTQLESQYSSYVFQCRSMIVGFTILSEQHNIEYIKSHYQLTTWTDITKHKVGCHGAINYFIVSPIFDKHTRFFLQELHRLSDYSVLYYKISPEDVTLVHPRRIACGLGMLLPVVPTNVSEYPTKSNEYWKLPDVLNQVEPPFSLYISTPLHCGLSRTEVNAKIVVVGGSDVALAFLVELIFKNNPNYRVTFNNVTLVSPHGVCRQRTNKIRDILIPSKSILHGHYLSQLSLRTYVNVVNGAMTAINRKHKTITVNDSYLPYDYLVLACGRQYQMPQRSEKLRGRRAEFPNNVFIVNSEIDVDIALTKLNKIISDTYEVQYTVIVYGHNMESLSCLAALLEFGIVSENLVYVDPTPQDDAVYDHVLIFDDSDVEDAVFKQIDELGIRILKGFHFIDWIFDANNDGITTVIFESKHKIEEVECIGMFAYCDKMISKRTFLAINHAGLVFDGGLVVGPDCQTNDPNIYAAGSITKYPRRYYADDKKHQYYNQEEIGRKLAEHFSVNIFHLLEGAETQTLFSRCADSNKLLVPQYTDPLVIYAVLPGKLYYLNVRKPGLAVPQDIALTSDEYGQVLLSGNCKSLERQGYFRLHLNQGNIVETITCLAHFPIPKVNLTCLWGKHERLLNSLVQRFEMVLVPDLFEFFKEDWAYVIYHDNYKKLNNDINDILVSLTEEEGNSLIEDVFRKFEEVGWKQIKPLALKELKTNFLRSDYKDVIMQKILNFFSDHMLYLPMYAHPLLVSVILGGHEESPYFKDV